VRPDLTIEDLLFTDSTPEEGEVIGISVIVKNNGNAPATAVSLVSYDNNEYFDEQAVDVIQPGQAHEFTLERKMDVGYHTLYFTVSSGEKEGDMNDNQAFEDMRVRSEPKGLPIPGLGPALTVLCLLIATMSVSAASSSKRRRHG